MAQSPPKLPEAGPLNGSESTVISQDGKARRLPIGSTLLAHAARLTAIEAAIGSQSQRDAAQDATLARVEADRIAADATESAARKAADSAATAAQATRDSAQDQALSSEASARAQADTAEATTRGNTDTAQATRISAVEGRAEEAVHFTASAALPAITALNPVTVTLTSLVPTRAGDVLKAGESVQVQPATALPAGINIAAARVPADGQVSIQLTTGIAIALQATPIVWNITALR